MTTLEARLAGLERDASAVAELGLVDEAARAMAVIDRARQRAGFPGSVYVLALAGGTGVGKSSILNALAGQVVSAAGAVRPTTDEPVAWVSADRVEELAALLAWLGIRRTVPHRDVALADVAILDLPDIDSVRTQHRARVDALLPRIDAVTWVVDPEKYDDERLHAYLRSLRPHAGRMRFVLNKIDRLAAPERVALLDDLRRRLAASGLGAARIHSVTAVHGDGIPELRAALAGEADAKALVVDKLAADARQAHRELGLAVGVDAGNGGRPLLAADRIRSAAAEAVEGALRIVDPPGVGRQVQAAALARARVSGGSLLGRAVALLGWLTGQRRRFADPAAYLRDWRRRGSLGRVVNPVHAALVEAAGSVPASSRRGILAALGAEQLEDAVARSLDAVARDAATTVRVPRSLLWPVVGAVQLVVGAVFVLAVAWYVTLLVAGGPVPVATIELPILGPVPLPLVLLAGSLAVSAALGFLLSLHAGWIGRRLGGRLADRLRRAVTESIQVAGMAGLERVESVRRSIAAALRDE